MSHDSTQNSMWACARESYTGRRLKTAHEREPPYLRWPLTRDRDHEIGERVAPRPPHTTHPGVGDLIAQGVAEKLRHLVAIRAAQRRRIEPE